MTHEESKPRYDGKAMFEVTEITFQTSIGTYLDSPYHRYPDRRDISQLRLDEVILPGVVIDVRGRGPFEAVGLDALGTPPDVRGRAVLFNFGWDAHWGREEYHAYPFIARDVIDWLIEAGAKLVGVDTINVDSSRDPERPAHSAFLQRDVLIVENMANLAALHGVDFRFFAVPIKGVKVAAMPVRAFAEVG